jgi:hypothetical protein
MFDFKDVYEILSNKALDKPINYTPNEVDSLLSREQEELIDAEYPYITDLLETKSSLLNPVNLPILLEQSTLKLSIEEQTSIWHSAIKGSTCFSIKKAVGNNPYFWLYLYLINFKYGSLMSGTLIFNLRKKDNELYFIFFMGDLYTDLSIEKAGELIKGIFNNINSIGLTHFQRVFTIKF